MHLRLMLPLTTPTTINTNHSNHREDPLTTTPLNSNREVMEINMDTRIREDTEEKEKDVLSLTEFTIFISVYLCCSLLN